MRVLVVISVLCLGMSTLACKGGSNKQSTKSDKSKSPAARIDAEAQTQEANGTGTIEDSKADSASTTDSMLENAILSFHRGKGKGHHKGPHGPMAQMPIDGENGEHDDEDYMANDEDKHDWKKKKKRRHGKKFLEKLMSRFDDNENGELSIREMDDMVLVFKMVMGRFIAPLLGGLQDLVPNILGKDNPLAPLAKLKWKKHHHPPKFAHLQACLDTNNDQLISEEEWDAGHKDREMRRCLKKQRKMAKENWQDDDNVENGDDMMENMENGDDEGDEDMTWEDREEDDQT